MRLFRRLLAAWLLVAIAAPVASAAPLLIGQLTFFRTYRDRGLRVVYIGSFYEKREALRKFAEEMQLDFPIVMDTEARLANLYDIRAYPQTLFISPEQKILAALLGGVGRAEMDEILGRYLERGNSAGGHMPGRQK